jgi:hypothetical protein
MWWKRQDMDEQYSPPIGAPQAILPLQDRRNQAMDATPQQPDITVLRQDDQRSPTADVLAADAASPETLDTLVFESRMPDPADSAGSDSTPTLAPATELLRRTAALLTPRTPSVSAQLASQRAREYVSREVEELRTLGGRVATPRLFEQASAARERAQVEARAAWQRLQDRVFPPDAFARPSVPPVPSLPEFRLPLSQVPVSEWPMPQLQMPPWSRPLAPSGSPRETRRLRDPRRHMLLISSLIVVGSMFISLLIPGLAAASAMKDYNDLRAIGESGMRHLLAVEHDFAGLSSLTGKSSGSSSTATASSLSCSTTGASSAASTTSTPSTQNPASGGTTTGTSSGSASSLLDPTKFQDADAELKAAQRDFQTLQSRLNRPDWVLATAASVPGLDSKLRSIEALADVGYDASSVGVEMFDAALPIVTRLHGSSSLPGDTELLTPTDLSHIQTAANDALNKLTDIQAKLGSVNLNDLPLCAKQKQEIEQVELMLPQISSGLAQGVQLIGAAGWILGVGQQRNFLVQTLDSSELRPSGGFTGNYGVLTISNGKVTPFTLYNVNDIDYGLRTNGWIFGRRPPAQYSWWPFANFGLRDSNLSADFPTGAQLIEQVFKNEGGGDVDGVIQFSPVAIAHVLRVTGPIYVPVFNETVTADNLVDKIHFYEEDPAGIAIQQRLFPDDHTHSLRKRFTQAVTNLLQDKVKHLSPSLMLPLAKQLLSDLQAKDIQVYVNNSQVENLLTQLRATGGIDTTPGVDGYFLAQANTSVSKLTPYVQMTQTDNITLDDNGGATHHLVMTFYNDPTGPIYGFSTYRDYVRIYVPPQAQLKSANGFDTGAPLCWAPGPGGGAKPARFAAVPDCGGNPFPSGALVCPRGQYGPGPMAYTVFGGDGKSDWVLDRVGGPTATATDVPNRAMWGGYVVVPRFCTATLTLNYYVPAVAAPSSAVPGAAAPYTMMIQRQGGTNYTVKVTIHPSPKMAASNLQTTSYSTTIADNTAFTLGNPNPESAAHLLGMGSLASLLGLDKSS